jgi:integrative and conjugative element protein (TIGR02256 family)
MRRFGQRPMADRPRVCIHRDAVAFVERESTGSPLTETGGVLAGRGSLESGEVHVTHASGPGPRARRTRYSFARDTPFCQRFLDEVATNTEGLVDYVGEWHKHQESVPRPSWRDVRTAAEIAANPDYHVRLCLLFIIGESNRRSALRAFIVDNMGGVEEVAWELCDDRECFEARTLTHSAQSAKGAGEDFI